MTKNDVFYLSIANIRLALMQYCNKCITVGKDTFHLLTYQSNYLPCLIISKAQLSIDLMSSSYSKVFLFSPQFRNILRFHPGKLYRIYRVCFLIQNIVRNKFKARSMIQLTWFALPYEYTCFLDGFHFCVRKIQNR